MSDKVGGWLDLPKKEKVGGWLDLPEAPSKRQDHFQDAAASSVPYDPAPMDKAWEQHFHAWSGMRLGS